MGQLNIPNQRHQTMPDCCANCKHNNWQEDGPHCRNPKNIEQDDFEKEENIPASMDSEDDCGYVEYDTVCDNHERGNPYY
jgi:hypothetical protein